MSPPRPHGDRAAIERALSVGQLAALEELVEDLGLDREGWHLAPSVACAFELAAFAREVRRIAGEEGVTLERARAAAAIRLGLNPETLERRLRDQRARARRFSPPPSEGAERSVRTGTDTKAGGGRS